MIALSLWQPWASLIAIGVKPYETRDWPPPAKLIGQRIAIHAAKKAVSSDDRAWAAEHGATDLPLGAIVCTARLIAAYQCGPAVSCQAVRIVGYRGSKKGTAPAELLVDEFGDYALGRWAWALDTISRFSDPVPALGRQGLWTWEREHA